MLFTISRASDKFMDLDHPTPDWRPHAEAAWHPHYRDWMIDIELPEHLAGLVDGGRLVVTTGADGVPHIEIDDLTEGV